MSYDADRLLDAIKESVVEHMRGCFDSIVCGSCGNSLDFSFDVDEKDCNLTLTVEPCKECANDS